MTPHPREEPSAGDRVLAAAARSQFIALVQAGFSEAQAIELVGQQLAVVLRAQIERGREK